MPCLLYIVIYFFNPFVGKLLYGAQGEEAFRVRIPNEITLNLVFFLHKKENRKISKWSRLSKEGTSKKKNDFCFPGICPPSLHFYSSSTQPTRILTFYPKSICFFQIKPEMSTFLFLLHVQNEVEDQAFSLSYDLAPPTPILLSAVSKLDRGSHRKIEKERQLADGRWGRSGGGAKSYDGEKAWSSINHSILSAYNACRREGKGVEPNPTKKGHNHVLFSFNSQPYVPGPYCAGTIHYTAPMLFFCLQYIISENRARQQENAPI